MSSSKQNKPSLAQLKHSSQPMLPGPSVSQTSANLTPAPSISGISKSRPKDASPSSCSAAEKGSECSIAIPITSSFSKPQNKQGFRFSLRRMLYNSPLVAQRRARSLSGGSNLSAANNSGTSTRKQKKQATSTGKESKKFSHST